MATEQPYSFGEIIRHFRRANGLTLEALAERAHLSVRGLSDLEHNRVHTPRHDTVELLVTALALSSPERALLLAALGDRIVLGAARAATVLPESVCLPPLVGRDRELHMLDRHLAGHGPPLLLLTGEPGIGKSRLLHEATQRDAARGLAVLTGGCHRRGGQEPYSPLLDAVEHFIRDQDSLLLRAELDRCTWLVRMLPELSGGPFPPLPVDPLPPEQERRLLFDAVRQFLTNVVNGGNGGVTRGMLLVLDDLQWAGSDALELLAALVRTAADVPLRVVAAYRDSEVQSQDPLAMLQTDLAVAGLAAHYVLGRLAAAEAAHLLDRLLGHTAVRDHALSERFLRHAEGMPFFLVSYAQALRSGGADEVPWDVAQSVRQRVALLPMGGQ